MRGHRVAASPNMQRMQSESRPIASAVQGDGAMSKGEPAMSTDLITIPGVGPNMKARLQAIGISCVEDLAGADPEKLQWWAWKD